MVISRSPFSLGPGRWGTAGSLEIGRPVPIQVSQAFYSTSPGPSGKGNLRNPVPPTQIAPGPGKQF